jgi:hypothetical protein
MKRRNRATRRRMRKMRGGTANTTGEGDKEGAGSEEEENEDYMPVNQYNNEEIVPLLGNNQLTNPRRGSGNQEINTPPAAPGGLAPALPRLSEPVKTEEMLKKYEKYEKMLNKYVKMHTDIIHNRDKYIRHPALNSRSYGNLKKEVGTFLAHLNDLLKLIKKKGIQTQGNIDDSHRIQLTNSLGNINEKERSINEKERSITEKLELLKNSEMQRTNGANNRYLPNRRVGDVVTEVPLNKGENVPSGDEDDSKNKSIDWALLSSAHGVTPSDLTNAIQRITHPVSSEEVSTEEVHNSINGNNHTGKLINGTRQEEQNVDAALALEQELAEIFNTTSINGNKKEEGKSKIQPTSPGVTVPKVEGNSTISKADGPGVTPQKVRKICGALLKAVDTFGTQVHDLDKNDTFGTQVHDLDKNDTFGTQVHDLDNNNNESVQATAHPPLSHFVLKTFGLLGDAPDYHTRINTIQYFTKEYDRLVANTTRNQREKDHKYLKPFLDYTEGQKTLIKNKILELNRMKNNKTTPKSLKRMIKEEERNREERITTQFNLFQEYEKNSVGPHPSVIPPAPPPGGPSAAASSGGGRKTRNKKKKKKSKAKKNKTRRRRRRSKA